jgi:hypothetical protein
MRLTLQFSIAAGCLLVVGCGPGYSGGDPYGGEGYGNAEGQTIDPEEIEYQARDNLTGYTYQDNWGSSGCTYDCSGHDAGYEWADLNGISDPSECGGNSESFIEGCEAYAEDLGTEMQNIEEEYVDELGSEEGYYYGDY